MSDRQTRRDVLRGLAVGGVGISLAGCAGSSTSGGSTEAGDDAEPTTSGSESDSDAGEASGSGGADADLTIEVGPGGEFKYAPESPTVSMGDTVRWVWKSNQHNIVIDKKPSNSDWSGTEGGSSKLFDKGHTHTHTFETAGTYEYNCSPHESVGMVATITVE